MFEERADCFVISLLHVGFRLGRCFAKVGGFEFICKGLALFKRYEAFAGQVALIANQYHRYPIRIVLHFHNLLGEDEPYVLKGACIENRVDHHVHVAVSDPSRFQRSEFVLPCCVKNLQEIGLAIDINGLAEAIFYGWVILCSKKKRGKAKANEEDLSLD